MIRPPAAPRTRPGFDDGVIVPGEPPLPPRPPAQDFDPGPTAPTPLQPMPTPSVVPSTAGTMQRPGGGAPGDIWNDMIQLFRRFDEEQQARVIANERGIFYRSAPLGWEGAGRYVRVPEQGDRPETVLWQLLPDQRPMGPEGPIEIPGRALDEQGAKRRLFNMDLTMQELVKSQLAQVGLLGANDVGPDGVMFLSDKIYNAWLELVGIAQSNGFEPESFLGNAVREGIRFRSDRTAAAPTIRVSDPDDIKQAANSIAQREIGRRLTPEELDLVVQPYQREEAQAQRRMLGGGTVAQAPGIDPFTTGVIAEQAGEEQALYSLGATLDDFMGMLGGR